MFAKCSWSFMQACVYTFMCMLTRGKIGTYEEWLAKRLQLVFCLFVSMMLFFMMVTTVTLLSRFQKWVHKVTSKTDLFQSATWISALPVTSLFSFPFTFVNCCGGLNIWVADWIDRGFWCVIDFFFFEHYDFPHRREVSH